MRSSSPRSRAGRCVVLSALVLAACARYETRPVQSSECAPEPQPAVAFVAIPRSGVAEARFSALTGRVVTAATGDSVSQATVLLRPRTKTAVAAHAFGELSGRFELDSLTPGVYLLEVRRLGYEVRRELIELPAGGSLQVVVSLRPAMLDGCPGFMAARVRKPWWRWW